MTDRTLPIAPRIIEIDETSDWNIPEYPEIKAIKGLFIYDKNLDVHICSFTPSRELYAIEPYAEYHVDNLVSDERHEEIQDMVLANWNENPVNYSDASYIDSITPFKDLALIELPFEEGTYEKEMEKLAQELRENGTGQLDGTCEGFPNWKAQIEEYRNRMEAIENENTV